MKRRIALSIGILLTLAIAVIVWQGFFASDLVNELPPHWDLDEIVEDNDKGRVLVLAWSILEDDRPLRLESCLVWRELEDGKGYTLTHLSRSPSASNPNWRLLAPDGCVGRVKHFDKRPTNDEIYVALRYEGVEWTFEIRDSWNRARCHVCEQNWLEATGEPPRQYFVLPQRGFLDSLGLSRWLNRR
jgi:hypothetical protein